MVFDAADPFLDNYPLEIILQVHKEMCIRM
jgi:hypothetical protein